MKSYIKTFESLSTDEKTHIHGLESIGFEITYVLDKTGHIYKLHATLPWHNVDILNPESVRKFISNGCDDVFNFTLHTGKSWPEWKAQAYGTQFINREYVNDRNVDNYLKAFYEWILNESTPHSFRLLTNLTQEEKDERKAKYDLSSTMHELW